MNFFDRIKSLFFGKKKENIAVVKAEFKVHYNSFKLLLTANKVALELMSEMESALSGGRPFGMNFVRSRCTLMAANVFQIVKYLNEISSDKYDSLFNRYQDIQDRIYNSIGEITHDEGSSLVFSIKEVDRGFVHQVGSKMANLGELAGRLGLEVPEGYVITAHSFRLFMRYQSLQAQIERTMQIMESDEFDYLYDLSEVLQDLIEKAPLPPEVESAILESYGKLEEVCGKNVPVAIRSSSPVEDLPGMSLAGQYWTELGVIGKDVLRAYKKVVASKYSYQSMVFRLNLGIRDDDVAMCVGMMPMVSSVAGGVLYTKDPLNSDNENVTVYSVFGLPKSVVEGSGAIDQFVVSRNQPLAIVEQKIAEKSKQFIVSDEGTMLESQLDGVSALKPSLSGDHVLRLVETALSIENHYGAAQDIEWSLANNGSLVFLQCRPLTQKPQVGRREKGIEDSDGMTIIQGGVTASPGAATGPVVIVRSEKDALNFPTGGVLVAQSASPQWAVLLNRAVAVVAETGSVAGHLASVARECGVPALFDAKETMVKLKEGQLVTVDADAGRIYEGSEDAVSRSFIPPISHIQGSPVYESLKRASEFIIPLNLLDPDGPSFTIENCRSNHDITRFCHEKAIKEIFSFGSSRKFSEKLSKRLFINVPMQYWVIDLDDGFGERAAADGNFVRLENIVSVPMLALWRGITAVDWEGPPPVDTRGFASAIFEATTDTSLLSSGPSAEDERNYFLITKRFLSFHSRIGYHFANVESLVGDQNVRDYLIFVFKGGAANIERRVRRTQLLSDILEHIGFHTRVIQDSLNARLESSPKLSVETGLEIVGHLIIHSRQLDMSMISDSAVEVHREKLLADIEGFLERASGTMQAK